MRGIGCLLAAGLILTAAGTLGQTGRVTQTQPGQPLCDTQEELQEGLQALLANDTRWWKSVDGCGAMPGGLKMAIIEKEGWLVKARVFLRGGQTVVGYTLIPE